MTPRQSQSGAPRIVIVGTGDTKAEELLYMRDKVRAAGGMPLMLDVSVLGDPPYRPEYDKHFVAAAAGATIPDIAASGDENSAMTLMAAGAARTARRLHDDGAIDGMLAIGGTMGTDLALDIALALPLGVPKFIVSTIAHSHLIPPERVAPDLMMILWAGGLYGLNETCRAVLSQACGAIVGAARSAEMPRRERPAVALSSLGRSCLGYMVTLKPALERRGYEVVVFHTTGMGGRAMEAIAARRGFVAVLDFSLQELANQLAGSVVASGPDRLENAACAGVPQIVAPGAIDMVDLPAWQPVPKVFAGRPYHAHNRLLGSVTTDGKARRAIARAIGEKLAGAGSPTAFILPAGGVQQWDREGEALYDPGALSDFVEEMRKSVPAEVEFHEIAGHVNDGVFVDKALEIFDDWVARGIVPPGGASAKQEA